MNTNLEELERKAKAATQASEAAKNSTPSGSLPRADLAAQEIWTREELYAALDPATVLELIRLARIGEQTEEMIELVEGVKRDMGVRDEAEKR